MVKITLFPSILRINVCMNADPDPMMSLKVGFSFCTVFLVLGERNREKEEFHN